MANRSWKHRNRTTRRPRKGRMSHARRTSQPASPGQPLLARGRLFCGGAGSRRRRVGSNRESLAVRQDGPKPNRLERRHPWAGAAPRPRLSKKEDVDFRRAIRPLMRRSRTMQQPPSGHYRHSMEWTIVPMPLLQPRLPTTRKQIRCMPLGSILVSPDLLHDGQTPNPVACPHQAATIRFSPQLRVRAAFDLETANLFSMDQNRTEQRPHCRHELRQHLPCRLPSAPDPSTAAAPFLQFLQLLALL
mmetsp:Transcript_143847/g.358597  ORF Transcript_143847/g.358597 Transcript_143847/m.358597 type:complete len:246 (+) Transcript_143847:636-1373(+)